MLSRLQTSKLIRPEGRLHSQKVLQDLTQKLWKLWFHLKFFFARQDHSFLVKERSFLAMIRGTRYKKVQSLFTVVTKNQAFINTDSTLWPVL
jgi:hypothetical protein